MTLLLPINDRYVHEWFSQPVIVSNPANTNLVHVSNICLMKLNTANRWRRSQFVHWISQLHFCDPLHCFRRELWTSTYLGLEPYLPTSEGCWCRELVKMDIQNLQSLLVCSIILWKVYSTKDDWIFGWRSKLASRISILFWSFTFLRCRHMMRLLNCRTPWIQFLRIRSWRRSMWICKKRFPIYHVYPKCIAALLCGAAIRMKASTSLQILDEVGMTLVDW